MQSPRGTDKVLCWKCESATIQTGYYTYLETVTVEAMKWPKECHCPPDMCEREPWMGLDDRTFTATTLIFKCRACGFQFQTDSYGIGLGPIDHLWPSKPAQAGKVAGQAKTPEQQQEMYGTFHRLAADPVVPLGRED